MNRKQESYRSMYLVVQEFVNNADPSLRSQMPNFNQAFDDFEKALNNLRAASEEQLYNRTGNAVEKQLFQEAMAGLTVNISNRIRAYAYNNANWVLYRKVDKLRSVIIKLKDSICLDYCQMVHDEANAILPALTTYGVVAQDLTNLQDAITKYLEWLPKPRTAIVDRRIQTTAVAQFLADCANKATAMDVHVRMLETEEPTFFNQYFYSRKLVNPGYRTIPLRGTITNQSNIKLSGVVVRINSLNVATISTATGRYEFKNLPAGVFNATVELEGYETITQQVAIVANQRTDVNITLSEGTTLRVAS